VTIFAFVVFSVAEDITAVIDEIINMQALQPSVLVIWAGSASAGRYKTTTARLLAARICRGTARVCKGCLIGKRMEESLVESGCELCS